MSNYPKRRTPTYVKCPNCNAILGEYSRKKTLLVGPPRVKCVLCDWNFPSGGPAKVAHKEWVDWSPKSQELIKKEIRNESYITTISILCAVFVLLLILWVAVEISIWIFVVFFIIVVISAFKEIPARVQKRKLDKIIEKSTERKGWNPEYVPYFHEYNYYATKDDLSKSLKDFRKEHSDRRPDNID